MVTGRVNTTNTGRTMALQSPINKAAINAAPKLRTSTPLYKYATHSSAAADKSHLSRSFIARTLSSECAGLVRLTTNGGQWRVDDGSAIE